MVIILTFMLMTTGLVISAAVIDFLRLKIPNIISGAIIGCFFASYFIHDFLGKDAMQDLSSHVMAGAIMLMIMVTLFFLRLFGGGDAKIIPAIALWTGLNGLPLFLMVTSIVGGVLAIISMILRKTEMGQSILNKAIQYPQLQNGWVNAMVKNHNVVPYGIAIAVGAVISFRHLGYLP